VAYPEIVPIKDTKRYVFLKLEDQGWLILDVSEAHTTSEIAAAMAGLMPHTNALEDLEKKLVARWRGKGEKRRQQLESAQQETADAVKQSSILEAAVKELAVVHNTDESIHDQMAQLTNILLKEDLIDAMKTDPKDGLSITIIKDDEDDEENEEDAEMGEAGQLLSSPRSSKGGRKKNRKTKSKIPSFEAVRDKMAGQDTGRKKGCCSLRCCCICVCISMVLIATLVILVITVIGPATAGSGS
jgi:hypothetical protein